MPCHSLFTSASTATIVDLTSNLTLFFGEEKLRCILLVTPRVAGIEMFRVRRADRVQYCLSGAAAGHIQVTPPTGLLGIFHGPVGIAAKLCTPFGCQDEIIWEISETYQLQRHIPEPVIQRISRR